MLIKEDLPFSFPAFPLCTFHFSEMTIKIFTPALNTLFIFRVCPDQQHDAAVQIHVQGFQPIPGSIVEKRKGQLQAQVPGPTMDRTSHTSAPSVEFTLAWIFLENFRWVITSTGMKFEFLFDWLNFQSVHWCYPHVELPLFLFRKFSTLFYKKKSIKIVC